MQPVAVEGRTHLPYPPPMPAPPIHYCRSVDGTSIAYAANGSGPTVLVSRAGNHLALEWDVSASRRCYELLGEELHLVRWDWRGFGLSGRCEDVSLERQIEDLRALMQEVGQPVGFLGIDRGAGHAIALAAREPHGVGAIVTLGGKTDLREDVATARTFARLPAGRDLELWGKLLDPDGVDYPGPGTKLLEAISDPRIWRSTRRSYRRGGSTRCSTWSQPQR